MLKHVSTPISSIYLTKTATTTISNSLKNDKKRQSSSSTTSTTSSSSSSSLLDSLLLNNLDCNNSLSNESTSSSSSSSLMLNNSIDSNITSIRHQQNFNNNNNRQSYYNQNHHHHHIHYYNHYYNNNNNNQHNRSLSSSTTSSSSSSTSTSKSLPSLIIDHNNNNNNNNNKTKNDGIVINKNKNERKIIIKIYTRVLCNDIEYKTLSITNNTTISDIIRILLKKFRINNRDPNLFYLIFEKWIKKFDGIPIRSVMILDHDDDIKPALLQSCNSNNNDTNNNNINNGNNNHNENCKFTLLMKRGEQIRVYNKCIVDNNKIDDEQSINILLSEKTNVKELIELIINQLNLSRNLQYDIFIYSPTCNIEQKLLPNDYPIKIRREWPNQDYNRFEIRLTKPQQQLQHNDDNTQLKIMKDFRKNFKNEFTMNLMGAVKKCTTTTTVATTNSITAITNSKIMTSGKVLYI